MRRIGTEQRLTDEERSRLLGELQYWKTEHTHYFGTREKEENAFNCVWRGQRPSGVREDRPEEAAWPFNGASDQRVRWGETAFNDLLAVIIVALDSCRVQVTCDGSDKGTKRQTAITRLVRWLRQKLGVSWYVQIQALMRYVLVDTPAVGAMDVSWRVTKTMGIETFSRDEIEQEYAAWIVASGIPTAEDGNDARNAASEDEAHRDFALALMGEEAPKGRLVQYLTAVRRVCEDDVDELIAAFDEEEDGTAQCRVYAEVKEGPAIRAMRYGDDFIIPDATEDFAFADPLIMHEWISEADLRARAEAEDWDEEWVEETLKTKGENFYDTRCYSSWDDMRNLVDIAYFYTAETDGDGVTTRYLTILSNAKGSAFGRRVIGARRGTWDCVFFRRDVKGGNCTSSTGLAHICSPDQGLAKSLKDGANNNAIIGSMPPVKAKGARVRNVVLEPFAAIPMGASDDVTWMQPPAYPAAALNAVKEIKEDMLAFLGLPNGTTDVSTRTQHFTTWMLAQFAELYRKLVEMAQDHASDAILMSVTGSADPKGIRREDLDGDFQLTLKFDPANLNHKDLIERTNALGQVIAPLDLKNEIDRGPVVREAFVNLFPNIADEAFKPSEQMAGEDIEEEQRNFLLIKAGVMPKMDTEGKWNYQARLDFYQELQQTNPDALSEMGQRSQQMLQEWTQALAMQARQHGENAEIGRTGLIEREGQES